MLVRYEYEDAELGQVSIENFDNGHLVCSRFHPDTDDTPHFWCAGIEKFIKTGRDMLMIWDKTPESMHPDTQYLQVPVFPTYNIWTRVTLTLDTRYERYQITWAKSDDLLDSEVLGYLNPGEGRSVVRSLLIQKMETEHELPKTCGAYAHNFNEEMQFRKRIQGPYAPAEHWMIWTTGRCIACERRLLEAFSDDVVPGRESTGVWT